MFLYSKAEINTPHPKKTKKKNANIPEPPSNSSSPELFELDGWKTNTGIRKKTSMDYSPILSRKIDTVCTTKVDDISQPQPQHQTEKIRVEERPPLNGLFACNPVIRDAEVRQAPKGTT